MKGVRQEAQRITRESDIMEVMWMSTFKLKLIWGGSDVAPLMNLLYIYIIAILGSSNGFYAFNKGMAFKIISFNGFEKSNLNNEKIPF